MSALAVGVLASVIIVLAVVAFGPELARQRVGLRLRLRRRAERVHVPDPGRRLRAERRAEQLLREIVGEQGWQAYRALGFLHAFGAPEADGSPGYGYLIYPNRPIVSFDARSGEILNELCVSFAESTPDGPERLPDADDALAKWMAIRADEAELLAAANLNAPGRQVDPDQARRDVVRLGEWTARPSSDGLAAAP